jgi:hypothetical protein
MLGTKFPGSNESLSQGTFVTQLLRNISNNPTEDFDLSRSNLPMVSRPSAVFNEYFLQSQDEVILKILMNLFTACKNTFPLEWDRPTEFILSKTTGYTGIMKALPVLVHRGEAVKDLSATYFGNVFLVLRDLLRTNSLQLDSESFPPNNTGESKLRDRIIDSLNLSYPNP